MTVCCRSNDVLYGCYGSNVVQFSTLLEYLAARIGLPVGHYYQVSDSFHAYTLRWAKHGGLDRDGPFTDYYGAPPPGQRSVVEPYLLMAHPETFDQELIQWMAREQSPRPGWHNPFFLEVAEPLWRCWDAYRSGHLEEAGVCARMCHASDWRIAVVQWLSRVVERRSQKEARENAKNR